MTTRLILSVFLVSGILFTSSALAEGKVLAFCGSASELPMEEAARAFRQKTGIAVELVWGGSGTVLSQMKLSRRGDLYIPGSPDYMAKAEAEGLIDGSTKKIIAYLVPAICVQKGNPLGIRGLADLRRQDVKIAIGNPESVCVGLYAIEIFEGNGMLGALQKHIVTHAASCSATASLVVMKKVDAVIGWDVFASWNPDKIELVRLGPGEIPRLAYIPAAVTREFCANREGALAFIGFLVSSEGRELFAKWGYISSEAEARKYSPLARIGGEYALPAAYAPSGAR